MSVGQATAPVERKGAGGLRKFVSAIDTVSIWAGKTVSWLCLVLVLIISYDVALRYFFRAPTVWQYDISYMLFGTVVMMGLPYVSAQRAHIRVDVIYNRLPTRGQAFVDVFFTLLFFFPLVLVLLKSSFDMAIFSYQIKEFSEVGFWRPQMWPFRSVLPIALALLLVQGVANFIRDLYKLVKGSEL